MVSLQRLFVQKDTILKQQPVAASTLPSSEQQKVSAGTRLVLQSFTAPEHNQHYKFSLKMIEFKGLSMNWYAFDDHVSINNNDFNPIQTIERVILNQSDKNVANNVANITLDQQGFLKIVFNVDTVIKRQPVPTDNLNDDSKQNIPAGTELILLTSKPDANRIVKFPIKDSHAKVSFKDVEFKGFNSNWFVFIKHAGIQRVI